MRAQMRPEAMVTAEVGAMVTVEVETMMILVTIPIWIRPGSWLRSVLVQTACAVRRTLRPGSCQFKNPG